MENALSSVVLSLLISFVVSGIGCRIMIPYLRKLKFGQNVRDDGPQEHLKKTGTPTMGGIMIIFGFLAGSLISIINNNPDGLMIVFATCGYGLIGFLDDFIKIKKKRSLGLKAYQKIILQVIVVAVFLFYVGTKEDFTKIIIPITGYVWDMGILFYPFVIIAIIGTVNAVNLTDGVDGLSSSITVIVSIFFTIASLIFSSSISPIISACTGSLLGFLLFNAYPAKVFMGDTGSLALGGFVVSVAVLLKMPLFIVLVGLIYFCEALSVMIQVTYFKLTKGKRFFKMAPLHHHFELSGYSETQIVTIFSIITIIMSFIGIWGLL